MVEPLPVIFSVKVRHKHLDDEALIVQPADAQTFPGKPISVEEHVRESVERELVEGGVQYRSFGEDACPGPNDSVIKEVSEGQNIPKPRL